MKDDPEFDEWWQKSFLNKLIFNPRILILLTSLILSIFWLNINLNPQGLIIESSTEYSIINGNTLIKINNQQVNRLQEFNKITKEIKKGEIVRLTILEGSFFKTERELPAYLPSFNSKTNQTSIGLIVKENSFIKLNFGLELTGGTKVILKPEKKLTETELTNLINVLKTRLNLFGVSGNTVSTIRDLTGETFIQVELNGVGNEQAKELLDKQGNFKAIIGNLTAFEGKDIRDVCVSGVGCTNSIIGNGNVYQFQFQLTLSQEASENFAKITNTLKEETRGGSCYLNEQISFYLDNEKIEGADLNLPCSIKGELISNPVITGSRQTREEAQNEVKFLQSILQSKNLPVKLNIESSQTVSPTQGREFLNNIFLIFIFSLLVVDIILAIRYKKPLLVLVTIFISLSEIIITLGILSVLKWTLDIASIAGILASVGTGINDQIVILDEAQEKGSGLSFKEKMKKAFFIVFAAFVVSFVSLIPLLFLGAGLLRGFALTTIIGISVGVLITRTAFAKIIEKIR